MNYRIISMDFDGTLLTSDKRVTGNTKSVLMKYKENGYIIVGITARNLMSVKHVCDINIFNYVILNNGANIYDVENDSIISFGNIDNLTIEGILNYFDNIADSFNFCTLTDYYLYKGTSDGPNIKKINDYKEINEDIVRINIFLDENKYDINYYSNYIKENFKDLDAFVMKNTDGKKISKWLAINVKDLDKYTGLCNLCLNLNIKTDEVIFFGDSSNDLKIINKVGLGVAMGNALDEVKNMAKNTTLSNDEEGIVYFLKNNI